MSKSLLQVQPQIANQNEWTALSEREGLSFEPLEFCMMPLLSDPDAYHACLRWYQNSKRVTAVHGAFIDVNPASSDPEFCALSRKRCEESCTLAAELGVKNVVLHSSCFPFLRGGYLTAWAEKCADFYMELAQKYGVGIRVENSQDVDPAPLVELMRRVQGTNVAVCLDIGHAHYSRAPIGEWFDQLGDFIAYLHLSDNLGDFDDHLAIGRGKINWAHVDALWRGLNRFTPITLEVGGIDGVRDSIAYLRKNEFFGLEENNHG